MTSATQDSDWRTRAAATRRRRSEERILAAASELFDQIGYEATTVEMIATKAAVGPATVYNRFGTKAAIVATTIATAAEPLLEAARHDIANDVTARKAVTAHLERAASLLHDHRGLAHAILYALADETSPELAPDRSHVCLTPVLQEPLAEIVAAGQDRGELRAVPRPAEAAMLATNMLLLRMLSVQDEEPHHAARGVVRFVMDGLSAAPESPPAPRKTRVRSTGKPKRS
jgi:AcrR family transcriptional regulator